MTKKTTQADLLKAWKRLDRASEYFYKAADLVAEMDDHPELMEEIDRIDIGQIDSLKEEIGERIHNKDRIR